MLLNEVKFAPRSLSENSGAGDWNLAAYDLGDPGDTAKLQMMGLDSVESADQVYLTFEAFF